MLAHEPSARERAQRGLVALCECLGATAEAADNKIRISIPRSELEKKNFSIVRAFDDVAAELKRHGVSVEYSE